MRCVSRRFSILAFVSEKNHETSLFGVCERILAKFGTKVADGPPMTEQKRKKFSRPRGGPGTAVFAVTEAKSDVMGCVGIGLPTRFQRRAKPLKYPKNVAGMAKTVNRWLTCKHFDAHALQAKPCGRGTRVKDHFLIFSHFRATNCCELVPHDARLGPQGHFELSVCSKTWKNP